ncbi:hypothetical protein GUJ93_ZPchr0015g6638 [Zizania palustris]|uniref:Lon proteolytic domain-containing protein n=1 Tax=Zizania palustris TaxID=103762 RepID=A0A8J5TLW5_ZIZPA|nr:hypothetical protein GUJ93_ZPchr0015g6638 [Zizania palustris]
MEVIELPGYTPEEKLKIAMRHLIPRVLEQHGLSSTYLQIPQATVKLIIERYRREAGLRNLERNLAALAHAAALKLDSPSRFDDTKTAYPIASPVVSVGLVWTSFGGEVQFVESTTMVGKGDLHLTGQLGDVIKESAQLALTWVRAKVADLKLSPTFDINLMESGDIHIHFPAGVVPKDGPSAGVTLVTSLVALFSHRKVRATLL